jgi:hypothetical protein
MKKNELQPSEIVAVLTPIINIQMMKQCSISSLKKDPENLLKQITAGAMKLTHNGKTVAILADLSTYTQIEQKRRELVAILEGATYAFKPTLGRRPSGAFANKKIHALKCCLDPVH